MGRGHPVDTRVELGAGVDAGQTNAAGGAKAARSHSRTKEAILAARENQQKRPPLQSNLSDTLVSVTTDV